MVDRGRSLLRASAHLLLQQDGDETGHDAGGERQRRQAARAHDNRVHAVSTRHQILDVPVTVTSRTFTLERQSLQSGTFTQEFWEF